MKKTTLLLLACGLLFSCNPTLDFSTIIPRHVDKFATDFVDNIKQGNIETCLSQVSNEMNNQQGKDYLTTASANLQGVQVDSIRIISAEVKSVMGDKGFTNYFIDYEYHLKDKGKFLYFKYCIHEKDNQLTITAFDGRFLNSSLTAVHAFTLVGKGFIHYLFLVLAILIPLFILVTLVVAIRTKLTKKWLWIIGILFGFIKFTINWTTGQIGFQLINITIFGAGFSKAGLVAPWTLSFALPLVAIVFWIYKLQNKNKVGLADQTDNSDQGQITSA